MASSASKMDPQKIAQGVRLILEGIGEDVNRDGLVETPNRVARMYQELLSGLDADLDSVISSQFQEDTEELILVRDIPFASMCEHHMVPFMGLAHVGYVPKEGRVAGISKLARVVDLASRRLQVQERMTTQIANALMHQLSPLGVVVVLSAEHLCMSIRGVKKPGTKTVTSAVRGCFKTSAALRNEAFSLINSKGS